MDELIILDVSHGTSVILLSEETVSVFDVPKSDLLFQALSLYNIDIIDNVFISHSDKDHIDGLIGLLASNRTRVKNLFINPDVTKSGKRAVQYRISISDAVKRYGLRCDTVNTSKPAIHVGAVGIEILLPDIGNFLSGPSGVSLLGKQIDSNSSSIVLRLVHKNHPIALLAADMNQDNLDELLRDSYQKMAADILVFPHHGGNCSSNNALFTEQLIRATNPKFTIFSLGRDAYPNPRRDIIDSIKSTSPNCNIGCTQLSKNCLSTLPISRTHWVDHLDSLPAAGSDSLVCCAGSIRIILNGSGTTYPGSDDHRSFVRSNILNAMCNRIYN